MTEEQCDTGDTGFWNMMTLRSQLGVTGSQDANENRNFIWWIRKHCGKFLHQCLVSLIIIIINILLQET
jgi:hypothetical protein